MQPESGVKTWQWVITVIVIVALIVIGIFVFGGKKTEAPTTEPTTVATTTMQTANGVIVSDQFPGNVVYISSVQAAQPTWIVIQKDNNGQPGAIIGSAHADAGIAPVKVILTQPTIDGGTYYAVMYTDNGSGKFSATADQPIKDANGNVIMKIFHATVTANVGVKG
ncbi:hypothetical protein KGQ27_01330 [Patescibacteria group bacterium]|nr:hypothetical protein [Patescibacteria group bacterium]MDE1946518.1 hypothetical protein [Patescibacteria group bacterium]MDE2010921.1 hypothetical protein [Patescibacteria group bacterium]MDE2233650.1 hypothetical protein [Patescibacteria group bacterium]